MGRNKMNLTEPQPKQIWQHIASGIQLLILENTKGVLACAVLNEAGTSSKYQVDVPADKFKAYRNRGMRLVGTRKTVMPKVAKVRGAYNPRKVNLGAETHA